MGQEKKFIKDLLNYYQSQLLAGYYQKRGKSMVIPNIIYCINRLLKNGQEKVKILDLGCGEGNLLKVVKSLTDALGLQKKVKFYGLDFDEDLINQAKQQNGVGITYFNRDLRHDLLGDLYGEFDLIICVNTFHEIFSSYLQDGENLIDQEKINLAKKEMSDLVGQIGKLLTTNGSLIFYDGLDLGKKESLNIVKFKIKTEILAHEFKRFIEEYSLGKESYKRIGKNIYQMKAADFLKFISTFKYLNCRLWPIESQEVYHSLNLDEWQKTIDKIGLKLEFQALINNDLGLWSKHVKLLNEADFPYKSVLFVASKKYLYSEFDYFC